MNGQTFGRPILEESAAGGPRQAGGGDPSPDALRAALERVRDRRKGLGDRVLYFDETHSTNDVAAQLASAGAPEGLLVLAASQTHGRGRQGRSWFSPPGAGLYFSIIFRPGDRATTVGATLLTLAAGVAVAEGIERASGLSAQIKWPNDLVVESAPYATQAIQRRKLAGILAEGALTQSAIQHVILGIGINVSDAACPAELCDRVTSLDRELGRCIDRFDVLAECLASLAQRAAEILDDRKSSVLAEWRRRSPSSVGAAVMVQTSHGVERGTTAGIDDDGSLGVEMARGRLRVCAGEVQWL